MKMSKRIIEHNLKSLVATILFVVLCILGISCADAKKYKDSYNILLIHSYKEGPVWQDELTQGVKQYFDENNVDVNISVHYMNTDFVLNRENIRRMNDLMVSYEQNPPDLIITFNNQATYSLLSSTHYIAYNVPIVFSGTTHYINHLIAKHSNITGYIAKPDFNKVYKLAKTLLKDSTLMLNVIVDGTPAGLSLLNTFKEQMNPENHSDKMLYYNVYDENIHDIIYWNKYYSKNVFVIMPKWNSFYSTLAHESYAPFFLVNNQGFGDGSLGGYMVPTNKQAQITAETALEVLKGRSIKSIPIKDMEQVPVFDWRELKKWDLNIKDLPKNTLIAHMPFYEKYKIPLQTGGGIVFVFILVAITQLILLYKEESRQKKDTLHKLLKQGKELELSLKSIPEGVISLDLANCVLTINKAAMQFLKLKGDATSYTGTNLFTLLDIHLPGNTYYLQEMILSTKGKEKNLSFDKAAYIKSPNVKDFPIKGDIAGINRDGIAYGTVITFTDISNELIQNELMDIAMNNGSIFTLRIPENHEGIYFSPLFFNHYQINEDGNYLISNYEFIKLLHPDDVELFHDLISSDYYLESKIAFKARINVNNKGYNWFEFRLSSMYDPKASTKKFIFGIVIDIQSYKQTEEELVAARDKAKQSDALKSAFLANMSHEIRTPLNAIVGFSNLLTCDDEYDQEDRLIFIDAINNNCRLLLALISDILDLARIESGSMLFKNIRCDVNELIEQIINTHQVIIPSNLRLIKEVPNETSILMIDCIRLNQVITNLINNAIKFTTKGYIKVGYTKEKEGYLKFFVEDTGRGIAEEDLNNVFNRFYKKNEFTQGAGLGLSICKVIVDRFNGTIQVTSKQGEGTRFEVRIPDQDAASYEMDSIVPNCGKGEKDYSQQMQVTHQPKNGLSTILIAEDEDSNFLLVKTILKDKYQLIRAKNGKEAIDIFRRENIDLILMDNKMPVMSGLDALTIIRKESNTIPIIMLSAYVFDSDIETAKKAGASEYLSKPVDVKLLNETIANFLS
jgi:signal transduction histidine kinase/ABC-type uncharacterized transport system substrate-binding protein